MRPPKPDSMKLLQGTARADRMNTEQPEFQQVYKQDAPPYLSDMARKIWDEIVPQLIAARVFTTIDEAAVAMLCSELAAYWKYEHVCRERTAKISTKKIVIDKDAYKLEMLKQMHFNNANKLMIQYGMTPVSRQRMKLQDPGGPAPLDSVIPPLPEYQE